MGLGVAACRGILGGWICDWVKVGEKLESPHVDSYEVHEARADWEPIAWTHDVQGFDLSVAPGATDIKYLMAPEYSCLAEYSKIPEALVPHFRKKNFLGLCGTTP